MAAVATSEHVTLSKAQAHGLAKLFEVHAYFASPIIDDSSWESMKETAEVLGRFVPLAERVRAVEEAGGGPLAMDKDMMMAALELKAYAKDFSEDCSDDALSAIWAIEVA